MAYACKDAAVTYLNRYGYNVVKFPRAGILPLLVLGRDRALDPIGQISTVWRTDAAPPQPSPPQPAVDIEGQKSDKLDLSIGLKMLANALAAFGATTPSLDFAYRRARKVQFKFTNVKSIAIEPFKVGEYLASGDLNLNNPFAARYFDDEDSRTYILTEVLQSDIVSVTATGSNDTSVALDVPAITEAVGANVKVSTGSESTGTLSYKGEVPVTFGFRAFEIIYVNGRWGIEGVRPSGDIAFAAPTDGGIDRSEGAVFNPGGLVRL